MQPGAARTYAFALAFHAASLPPARVSRALYHAPMLAPHIERHFTASAALRDVVIGMSDGLTVPFALAAGLSSAIAPARIVVTAGLAELAAGAIAMGLGGYLAARSDTQHYRSERRREEREVREKPDTEAEEIYELFATYGLPRQACQPVVDSLRQRPDAWVDFMMRFELGIDAPAPQRAVRSALTIGGAYVAGGLIPLLPYMLAPGEQALLLSVLVTLCALFVFGAVKGRFTGAPLVQSGLQTVLVGGLAAAAAFFIARLFA